jgi:hypothetical protein
LLDVALEGHVVAYLNFYIMYHTSLNC